MDFAVSYPESGNTWIRLVHAAYHADDVGPSDLTQFDEKESPVSQLMQYSDADPYYYQSVCPFPIERADLYTKVRLRPAAMLVLEREVSLAPTPPLVKSHHIHGKAGAFSLWNSQWTDKVVNPVRDPREICYLYANRNGESYEETAQFMAKLDAQVDGDDTGRVQYLLSTWSKHVEGWLNAEDLSVFSVRHEDLRRHPVEICYDIFDFLEVPDLDESKVEEAVQKTRVETLQTAGTEHGLSALSDEQGSFSHSGQADGWKDELPTDVTRKIEQDHGEVMEAFGYL
jgi:hypothetical protein